MSRASELAKGSIVEIQGLPHIVEELQVQTPSARGGASLYKVRFRNLATRQKVDKSFRGDDPLRDMDFERREVQFLYFEQDRVAFMDLSDYSQFELPRAGIEDQVLYLTDSLESIQALVADSRIVGIELRPVVELPIAECDPSAKGASATARTKPATLSTGLVIQVPDYMERGEVVRVDTRTGKFVSRA